MMKDSSLIPREDTVSAEPHLVHVKTAGLASRDPRLSIALTRNEWDPRLTPVYVLGVVHGAN
jgi:hypothetical protein